MIIFITGVSTAGKTTLYRALRDDEEMSGIEFHDIDEDGIPEAGSSPWRKFRIELLLWEAAERFREHDLPTVICGATIPHEAIESGSYPLDIPVHFVLINISIAAMRTRLAERIGEHVSIDDLELSIQMNRTLIPVLRNSVRSLRNGHVIDSGPKAWVYAQVKSLILEIVGQGA